MKATGHVTAILSLTLLSGCNHSQPEPHETAAVASRSGPYTITHYARTITLTRDNPRDRELGITLVEVKRNGTAVIDVASTGERLSAAPGKPFLGRRGGRYNVRTFGNRGLVLEHSDSAAQSAVLVARSSQSG